MRWLEVVERAIEELGGIAKLSDIYDFIETADLRPLSSNWRNTVRQTLEDHSSDSQSFRSGRDTFYSVEGLGRGVWGLRRLQHDTPAAADVTEPTRPSRQHQNVYRILRDTFLSRSVKALLKNACQICGLTIVLPNGERYAEVHHLRPLGSPHDGPDVVGNTMVLCPNHHTELDYGAIGIEPDTLTIRRHSGEDLGKLKTEVAVEKRYLEYHWNNIFKK